MTGTAVEAGEDPTQPPVPFPPLINSKRNSCAAPTPAPYYHHIKTAYFINVRSIIMCYMFDRDTRQETRAWRLPPDLHLFGAFSQAISWQW